MGLINDKIAYHYCINIQIILHKYAIKIVLIFKKSIGKKFLVLRILHIYAKTKKLII